MVEDINTYINKQLQMRNHIDRVNRVDLGTLHVVTGIDLAYWKYNNTEYAACCAVTIDFNTLDVVEKQCEIGQINLEYIPGCLGFREVNLIMQTLSRVNIVPDVIICDGNGYLHPRNMGEATHLGILTGIPTIGVAKTYHKIGSIEYKQPAQSRGSYTNIIINNEVYGRAVRTRPLVKPVFVSIGNMISLDMATEVVLRTTKNDSRIPVPTRLADIMSREMRQLSQSRQGQ